MAIFLLENIYEGNVYMGTCITFKNTTELFSKVHLKLIQNCKSTILQLKKKLWAGRRAFWSSDHKVKVWLSKIPERASGSFWLEQGLWNLREGVPC